MAQETAIKVEDNELIEMKVKLNNFVPDWGNKMSDEISNREVWYTCMKGKCTRDMVYHIAFCKVKSTFKRKMFLQAGAELLKKHEIK